MSDGITNRGLLIPLTEGQLDLLAWFGAWTPEVHRAAWKARRRWPPGYRAIADLSVNDSRRLEEARAKLSEPPRRRDLGEVRGLVAYGLLEGRWRCARLTRRGRAAVLLSGRAAPTHFESHCADIFDDVDLRPVLDRHFERMEPHSKHFGKRYESLLPDDEETWREMLVEYNEDDYAARGTLTGASATLVSASSTGTYLNGSLRKHHRYLSLKIQDSASRVVCEASFSLEGLADLLTAMHAVPVTLDFYLDGEGMARSEPAPPPVSPMRRMQKRLKRGFETQDKRFDEIVAFVESAKMGKRAKAELLDMLGVCQRNAPAAYGHAVTRSVEEMSAAVESMLTIASERTSMAAGTPLSVSSATRAMVGLEGAPDEAGEE